MFRKQNNASQPDYRNWSEQFKELNVPMPEQGAFAWRRQQLSLQRSSAMAAPEQGPNLLQRAFTVLQNKLSARTSSAGNSGLNNRQATSTGAIAK